MNVLNFPFCMLSFGLGLWACPRHLLWTTNVRHACWEVWEGVAHDITDLYQCRSSIACNRRLDDEDQECTLRRAASSGRLYQQQVACPARL